MRFPQRSKKPGRSGPSAPELTADWVVDDRCGDTRPEMVGIDWNSGMAEPAPPHNSRARQNMPQSIRMVPKMSTQ